jgi:carboxylate-amine ligase
MVEETLALRTGADGEPLEPALLEAVEAGTLTIANALGNGVADDKTVFAYVPRLVEYYLGEKPETPGVATFLCGEAEHREQVLDRIDELVVKPVDGFGGKDIFIGPRADEGQRKQIRRRVLADPAAWVAQELVQLSTMPAFDGAGLEPRHVDLRVFVLLGEQTVAAPAALTRVAPPGSLVVNSSAGGGAKDTWLLGS